jgi:hypothetical protein
MPAIRFNVCHKQALPFTNLDSLIILFIPFSVENIVGIMEIALESQFRGINKELETLALQNNGQRDQKGLQRVRKPETRFLVVVESNVTIQMETRASEYVYTIFQP